MDQLTIIQSAYEAFSQSYFFLAIKIFFGIYSVVLILDLILLFSLHDVSEFRKQRKFGSEYVPSLSKSAMDKQWSKIEERLRSGSLSEYKVAILEADAIVEGILKDVGYNGGANMAQKIEKLGAAQPDDAAMLSEAHQIRNRIIQEQDFHPDLEQTKKTLESYKDFLKKFDYFQ